MSGAAVLGESLLERADGLPTGELAAVQESREILEDWPFESLMNAAQIEKRDCDLSGSGAVAHFPSVICPHVGRRPLFVPPSAPYTPSVSVSDRESLLAAATNLANDCVTATLVSDLRERGIRPILLKAASIRHLLDDSSDERVSYDIDLLMSERELGDVESVLPELGFESLGADTLGAGRDHDRVWVHTSTGLLVELHTSISGIAAPATHAWSALTFETDVLDITGLSVEILGETALVCHLVLNAAHHGRRNAKTMADLDRALTLVSSSTWPDVAALAARLDALPAFAAGLGLDPRGEALLQALRIHVVPDALAALRADTAPPLAQGFGWLMQLPSISAKARFVARALVPPRKYLRLWWPPARRGGPWLAAAYVWRPIWIVLHLFPAVRAWRRASRSSTD